MSKSIILKGRINTIKHKKERERSVSVNTQVQLYCILASTTRKKKKGVYRGEFDFDVYQMALDTGASVCISNNSRDFIGPIKQTRKVVDGIAEGLQATGVQTIRWRLQDKEGRKHKIDIPNSLLVPKALMRIMSPQHLA